MKSILRSLRRNKEDAAKMKGLEPSKQVNNFIYGADVVASDAAPTALFDPKGKAARNVFDELPDSLGGRTSALLEQLRCYVEDKTGVIAIYGMGGVGKTTLLRLFVRDLLRRVPDFDVVIPVEVSYTGDVEDVQMAIVDCLGLPRHESSKSAKQRASVVSKALRKKRFLLLLDGLWDPLDLDAAGIPVPDRTNNSTIIFTTRNENTYFYTWAEKAVAVECLPWEDSWDLLVEIAGEELVNSGPEIHSRAEELAMRCAGLPAAIVRAGLATARMKNSVIKEPANFLGMDERFLYRLKLSYDHLGNYYSFRLNYLHGDKLRACFLYCSLFPLNRYFLAAWVFDYWVGEGIIDASGHGCETYRKARDVIRALKEESLLEISEEQSEFVRVHPVIRFLALWIADECGRKKNKWFVRAGSGLSEVPDIEDPKEVERISLMENNINELPESPNFPSLVALILKENCSLTKIPAGFFQFMTSLKLLDLSDTSIEELPGGIGTLSQLQYLSLSNTKINSLPKELAQLVRLRVLNLQITPNLQMIPRGLIKNLVELQLLSMYVSYGDWKVGSVGGGVDIKELQDLKNLKSLGIDVGSVEALASLENSNLSYKTGTLHLKGCRGLKSIGLQKTQFCTNMDNLRWLMISESNDLEEIVFENPPDPFAPEYFTSEIWPPPGPLSSLELLYLVGLDKTKIFWEGGSLENLVSLNIAYCYGMENLFYYKDAAMSKLRVENWVIRPFPRLKELRLDHLPRLDGFTNGVVKIALECLQLIEVEECPKLKKFPLFRPHERIQVRGSRDWWDSSEIDKAEPFSFAEL